MITQDEKRIAEHCITYAMSIGADAVRISMSKSVTDGCTIFNGVLDKVSHSADRSIYLYLYVDGRYGTFSTNRLEKSGLEDFISKAISMVRMLGKDEHRSLPAAERTAKDALTGLELGLYDARYEDSSSSERLRKASEMSIYGKTGRDEDFEIISEECEYSESKEDNLVMDSQGFCGMHSETCFSCFCEMNIEDKQGNKHSSFWWESSFNPEGIDLHSCSRKALERAASHIGPRNRKSGKYRMVVDTNVASKLISPVISALNSAAIQQKMSFLEDSVGNQVFPEGMTLMDMPRTRGRNGSRLFDTEGVATKDTAIIDKGVVKQYFTSTYMANKLGIEPTIEDISRPCLLPFVKGETLLSTEKEVSLKDIVHLCGNGILVTGFNGGNCNPVTGDFSYGIEGFAFSRGKITHPVKEMLITGNIMELWQNLIAAGTDSRSSVRWQIPSIAFENVSFSA